MRARVVVVALSAALALSGCSEIEGFREQIDSVRWCSDVVRLAAAVETANPEAARNLVDALDRSGPEDLADDVGVVRAVVERIEAGEAEAGDLPSKKVRAAVGRLTDAVEQRCEGEVSSELDAG